MPQPDALTSTGFRPRTALVPGRVRPGIPTWGGDLDQVRLYWEEYAERVLARGERASPGNGIDYLLQDHGAAYAKANASLVNQVPGRAVLELGAGVGLDTVWLARAGARLVSVDLSRRNVELTRQHLAASGVCADVRAANAERLPFPSGSFDVVIARGVLGFTPDPRAVVREVRRVLRPGGLVQAVVGNRRSWYVLLARAAGMNLIDPAGDPAITRLYSRTELAALFREFDHPVVRTDRLPVDPARRAGVVAGLFNALVVPTARLIPRGLLQPFGYYLILEVRKPR